MFVKKQKRTEHLWPRKSIGSIAILSLCAVVLSCSPAPAAPTAGDPPDHVAVSFMAFTAGGLTQVAADAMAEAVRLSYPEWKVDSMSAGGIARLTSKRIAGEVEFFFTRSSRALELEVQVPLHPDIDFEQAAGYRLVMPFSSQFLQIVVLNRLEINSLTDVVTRKYPFRLGSGIGAVMLFSKILEYHGATLEEAEGWGARHEAIAMSTVQGAEALQTGRVDIGFTQAPIPGPFFVGLALDASILPIDEPGLVAMLGGLGSVPATIPRGTYPFVDADVPTVAFPYLLVARTDLPDDIVYNVVRAIFERSDLLFAVNADAREHMTPESVAASVRLSRTVGEPYHPGALKFYREMGWLD